MNMQIRRTGTISLPFFLACILAALPAYTLSIFPVVYFLFKMTFLDAGSIVLILPFLLGLPLSVFATIFCNALYHKNVRALGIACGLLPISWLVIFGNCWAYFLPNYQWLGAVPAFSIAIYIYVLVDRQRRATQDQP